MSLRWTAYLVLLLDPNERDLRVLRRIPGGANGTTPKDVRTIPISWMSASGAICIAVTTDTGRTSRPSPEPVCFTGDMSSWRAARQLRAALQTRTDGRFFRRRQLQFTHALAHAIAECDEFELPAQSHRVLIPIASRISRSRTIATVW
jgi:hypothetical protein